MVRVTTLELKQGGSKRLIIVLDDGTTFSLGKEVAIREGLKVGRELSQERLEALKRMDCFQRCYDAACHFLSYRPRSEAEVRQRLIKRRFDVKDVEAVLAKLKDQRLLDDLAFACFWCDNRTQFSPRSRYLTGLELRQKGVSAATIDEVVVTIDDAEHAYRAARDRLSRVPQGDYQLFRRRLGDFLRRRGFNYGVIAPTIARLWQESSTDRPSQLP